jgi:transposase
MAIIINEEGAMINRCLLATRRDLLSLALFALCPIADSVAQSAPTLGYAAAKNANPDRLDVFKKGLSELGYIEGRNLQVEYSEGVLDADYQRLMAEFVDHKVKIILAANAPAALAAAKATTSLPIVILAVNDPVGLGLVKSLDRPGTNVTGTTMYAPQLIGDRLRMLQSIIPSLDKIAMVMNGNNPNNAAQVARVYSEARGLGIAEAHQFCLAHLIRDAQYAIDHGDTIFAPQFKAFLKDACEVGRRRPDLADSTIGTHRRRLDRELDRLLDLKPTDVEGSHLRAAIAVTARDKLLVFLTRRDVAATNNESERALRPSVIFRRVTNGFRSEWGAKVYADLCSIVTTGRLAGRSALAAIRDALAAPAHERTAA